MVLVVAIVVEAVFSMTPLSMAALSLHSAMALSSLIPNCRIVKFELVPRNWTQEDWWAVCLACLDGEKAEFPGHAVSGDPEITLYNAVP